MEMNGEKSQWNLFSRNVLMMITISLKNFPVFLKSLIIFLLNIQVFNLKNDELKYFLFV